MYNYLKQNKNHISIYYYIIMIFMLSVTSCQKDFLDKKPSQALLVPSTLTDFQALLDNANSIMNGSVAYNTYSDGDFVMTDAGLASQDQYFQSAFLWAADIYLGSSNITDWNKPYQQIFYSNVVLDGLLKIQTDDSNVSIYNQIKGSALFYRAFALFNLTQEFTIPYNASTANQAPGVPIRTSSDVNLKVDRGTLQQSFDAIIKDLNDADLLLPDMGNPKTRPGKAAARAMLSRVYLVMGDYQKALDFATASLIINSKLLDYATFSTTATTQSFPLPLTVGNDEMLYYTRSADTYTSFSTVTVNPDLYNLYQSNDLRKVLYFKATGNYKGSYNASNYQFNGLATDEVYLIRAECYARLGNLSSSLNDLNTLLAKRLKPYSVVSANNADDALKLVLLERRKELVARGTRWFDLRRLNQDSRFAVTLTRNFNGVNYMLLPNDRRYVFLIPQTEIDGNGIVQNPSR